MKTFLPKVDEIERKWFVVDAQGRILGRLASAVASILMGKDKPHYTAFLDTGDFVIIVNADKVKLTGKKLQEKVYYSHSGQPGSLKQITAKDLLSKHPERVVRSAVRGMLPKNRLGRKMLSKLKVYAGPEHRHQAQKPEPLAL